MWKPYRKLNKEIENKNLFRKKTVLTEACHFSNCVPQFLFILRLVYKFVSMKNMILAALLLFTVSVSAQENIYLRGFVYDKEANNAPMSTAAVQIKNTQLGGLTDDNGYFEIPIPKINLKDSIKASYVGYLPQSILASSYQEGDTLRFYLASSAETKQEAVIVSYNARGVLLKAIENLRKNLFTDSIVQTGFYRQYHKENGKYVRLIEADVIVAFNIKSPYKYSFHELMQINKLRRSNNFEHNVDANNHGDHLADLLKENPFSYNKGTFLNPRMIDFFAPKFESEDSAQFVINTQYKESSSAKLEQAKVWVEKETFAILRIEISKYPNPYYVKSRYANTSIWKLVNETDVVELEKRNGKFFVSALKRTYNHHVTNPANGQVEFVVEETFDLYFNQFDTEDVGEIVSKGKFAEVSEVYLTKYKYDENFWNHYDALDEYPLTPEIKTDLELTTPLAKQFVEAGR